MEQSALSRSVRVRSYTDIFGLMFWCVEGHDHQSASKRKSSAKTLAKCHTT